VPLIAAIVLERGTAPHAGYAANSVPGVRPSGQPLAVQICSGQICLLRGQKKVPKGYPADALILRVSPGTESDRRHVPMPRSPHASWRCYPASRRRPGFAFSAPRPCYAEKSGPYVLYGRSPGREATGLPSFPAHPWRTRSAGRVFTGHASYPPRPAAPLWAGPAQGGDARGRPNGIKTCSARYYGRYTRPENALVRFKAAMLGRAMTGPDTQSENAPRGSPIPLRVGPPLALQCLRDSLGAPFEKLRAYLGPGGRSRINARKRLERSA